MKEILMMMLPTCPYCRQANKLIEEIQTEHPEYQEIPIRRVDESREAAFADSLDYYFVPTLYVDGKKIMEGVPTKEKIIEAFEAAKCVDENRR